MIYTWRISLFDRNTKTIIVNFVIQLQYFTNKDIHKGSQKCEFTTSCVLCTWEWEKTEFHHIGTHNY